MAGEPLSDPYVWSFTTGTVSESDVIPPIVSSTSPSNNVNSGVLINSLITANFSEEMNPLTLTPATFTLQQGNTFVSGTITYAGFTATFTPLNPLAPNTIYTSTITTGTKDLAGNALAGNYIWNFITYGSSSGGNGGGGSVSPKVTTLPTVMSTIPVNTATGVVVNSVITAVFSEAMQPLTK